MPSEFPKKVSRPQLSAGFLDLHCSDLSPTDHSKSGFFWTGTDVISQFSVPSMGSEFATVCDGI
jgi:hypothetical protein